jgi:hypothetical protein
VSVGAAEGSQPPALGTGGGGGSFWDLGIGGGDAFSDFAIAAALVDHEPEVLHSPDSSSSS